MAPGIRLQYELEHHISVAGRLRMAIFFPKVFPSLSIRNCYLVSVPALEPDLPEMLSKALDAINLLFFADLAALPCSLHNSRRLRGA